MRISVYGSSPLADFLRRGAQLRGFELVEGYDTPELVFAAQDVIDHEDLSLAKQVFDEATRAGPPVVLVSQVPPGTTRNWAAGRSNIYCQIDTLIMRQALGRAYAPEQFIVGCADPEAPLPLSYQQYLWAHECPVHQMSYESAELAKLAINYFLAAQIRTTNELADIADRVGAKWADVARALAGDARIGPHAYLRPGKTNQHLDRDVSTVEILSHLDITPRGGNVILDA